MDVDRRARCVTRGVRSGRSGRQQRGIRPRDAALAVLRGTEAVGGEAPSSVRAQVYRLLGGLGDVLSQKLRGVYLHGSLALGCFNPVRSDVDVLVVVAGPLQLDEKLRLVDLLLSVSAEPHKVEL